MRGGPLPGAALVLLFSLLPSVLYPAASSELSAVYKGVGLAFVQLDARRQYKHLPINEEGYQAAADRRSNFAMGRFIKGVIKHFGGKILSEASLQGIVPFYSGALTHQNFDQLVRELFDAPWVSWNASDAKATKYIGVVREKSKRRRSAYMAEAARKGMSPGAVAALSELGFHRVAEIRDDAQMEIFLRRLIALRGGYVDESHVANLQGVVPFYSGTTARNSYSTLLKELEAAPWISHVNDGSIEHSATASLSEGGYVTMMGDGNADGMELFVRRLVASRNGKVLDPNALRALADLHITMTPEPGTFPQLVKELESSPFVNGFRLEDTRSAANSTNGTEGSEDLSALADDIKLERDRRIIESAFADLNNAEGEVAAQGVQYGPSAAGKDTDGAGQQEEEDLDKNGGTSDDGAGTVEEGKGVSYGPQTLARTESTNDPTFDDSWFPEAETEFHLDEVEKVETRHDKKSADQKDMNLRTRQDELGQEAEPSHENTADKVAAKPKTESLENKDVDKPKANETAVKVEPWWNISVETANSTAKPKANSTAWWDSASGVTGDASIA